MRQKYKKSCGIQSTGQALPTVFIKGCTEDRDTGKAEKIKSPSKI